MSVAVADSLAIGVAASGITHSAEVLPTVRERFELARAAGEFDFVCRSPPDVEFRELLHASEATGLPVLAGTFAYVAGRDEPLFERNVVKARLLGARVHDVQLMTHHADGHPLSDDEVAEAYLRCHEFAARHEVAIGFETHIDTWSEHPARVARVADRVSRRGIPFGLTFDPSHVIFKIDNPAEQRVQGLDADVASGSVVIDPARPGNVLQQWIEAGHVVHCHARAAAPANPINVWARHPDGSYGRGVQYPLLRPAAGEWHCDWDESRLEPWKLALRSLLGWHAKQPSSRLLAVTCEFIPAVDYGGGARYSILAQNVECARWLRQECRILGVRTTARAPAAPEPARTRQ